MTDRGFSRLTSFRVALPSQNSRYLLQICISSSRECYKALFVKYLLNLIKLHATLSLLGYHDIRILELQLKSLALYPAIIVEILQIRLLLLEHV